MDLNAMSRWESIAQDMSTLATQEPKSAAAPSARRSAPAASRSFLSVPLSSSPLPPSPPSVNDLFTETLNQSASPPVIISAYDSTPDLHTAPAPPPPPAPLVPTVIDEETDDNDNASAPALSPSPLSSHTSAPILSPRRPQSLVTADDFAALLQSAFLRGVRRFAKGLTIGFGVKAIFAFLGLLVKNRGNVVRIVRRPYVMSALVGEPLAYGIWLGTLLATFETTIRVGQMILRQMSDDTALTARSQYALITAASLICSVSLRALPESHWPAVTLFFAVRAMEVIAKAVARAHAKSIPPIIMQHGDIALFAVSSMQICWAALYNVESLDSSYYAFLSVHSGKHPAQLALAAQLHGAVNPSQPAFMDNWSAVQKLLLVRTDNRELLTRDSPHCAVMHPGQGCVKAGINFAAAAVVRALPVYVPVYVIPLAAFNLKRIIRDPQNTVAALSKSILRSTLFLSAYCTSGWSWMCFLRFVLQSPFGAQWHAAAAGLLAGLSLLIEKKSRRIELALFCFSHALHSAYYTATQRGYIPPLPRAMLLVLFGLSLCTLLHSFSSGSELLRPSYASALAYFFGSGIKRDPVNKTLIIV